MSKATSFQIGSKLYLAWLLIDWRSRIFDLSSHCKLAAMTSLRADKSSLGVWDRGLMARLVSDRPRSWGLGLAALVLVLVLVLYFWSCFQHCCARQGAVWHAEIMWNAINTCIFSCNKCRNSAKRNWSSYHFWRFFAQSYFLITNVRVAQKFFC